MRVKALSDIQAYYNYGLVTLAAADEVKGGLALFLLETGSDVEPVDDDAKAWRQAGEAAPASDAPAVVELPVDATAAEVLDWAGDDPNRAEEALAVELEKDKPRSTLVKALEKLTEQS